jgi:hypothetical protein
MRGTRPAEGVIPETKLVVWIEHLDDVVDDLARDGGLECRIATGSGGRKVRG